MSKIEAIFTLGILGLAIFGIFGLIYLSAKVSEVEWADTGVLAANESVFVGKRWETTYIIRSNNHGDFNLTRENMTRPFGPGCGSYTFDWPIGTELGIVKYVLCGYQLIKKP